MQKDLNELVDSAHKAALTFFKNSPDSQIPPTFNALTDDGGFVLIGQWEDEEEREAILLGARQIFAERNVQAYTFVFEAWMSAAALQEKVRPGQASDRIEVLMIFASDSTETVIKILKIIRDDAGLIVDLEDANMPSDGMVGGPVTELLRVPKTPH